MTAVLLLGCLWIGTALSSSTLRRHRADAASTAPARLDHSLAYVALDGRRATAILGDGTTLLMLVDSRCGHCELQLQQLRPHSARLASAHVYVLTTEPPAAAAAIASRWSPSERARVTWGSVNPYDAKALFGRLSTPAMLVVDASRLVRHRYVGETAPSRLIAALDSPPQPIARSLTGPRTR